SVFTFLCLGRLSLGSSTTARARRSAGLFHCQTICARILSTGERLWFSSVEQWVVLGDESYQLHPPLSKVSNGRVPVSEFISRRSLPTDTRFNTEIQLGSRTGRTSGRLAP